MNWSKDQDEIDNVSGKVNKMLEIAASPDTRMSTKIDSVDIAIVYLFRLRARLLVSQLLAPLKGFSNGRY